MFWKKQEEDGKGGKPFELNFEQIFFFEELYILDSLRSRTFCVIIIYFYWKSETF